MAGTLLNVVSVVVGATAGVVLGDRLPERVRRTVMDALGLFTLLLGVAGGLDAFGRPLARAVGRAAVLVVVGSAVCGGVLGEVLDLEGRLERLGRRLRDARAAVGGGADGADSRFVEGFVVASLVFCVGPLTVLGAVRDGLRGDYELLAIKSLLDGFASLAFASTLGAGVGFAALTVLVVQGGISLAAARLDPVLTAPGLAAMNAVGGLLVMGIGLRLLDVRRVRVTNLLPGLGLAPLAVALWP
ncbi:MAG: DUF554 domain-containing protein [Actinomycetota bacterium]|nr:DUF554 domain-containing protein [Actinomycetota bacterium]